MHRSLISAAIGALIGLSSLPASCAAPPAALPAQASTQLPRNAVPVHYEVSLTPDAQAATFRGTVSITLDLLQPGTSVTLNAVDLAFAGARMDSAGQAGVEASRIALDPATQSATVHFAQPLGAGRHRLTLDYSGRIGSQASGLFALDYQTEAGRQRALYTQFENSDARRMIPCWDEPAYKATFALDVTVPAADSAISNMPVAQSRDLGDGRKLVRFATTPKMSSYLLFFGLGQFERASAMADGAEVGVVTPKGKLAQGRFALEAAQTVLREYNDYFGLRYPLPKLDNIAAPGRSQFFGAMENWGAIFTFEHLLLLDPAISTQADKQSVFEVLAHETAHQWFGDLVTMRWWDDLWLNEGFASWMESRTTARLHPEWNTSLGAVGVREAAMGRDALRTSHPIVQRIATVEQASQAFDSITYSKGESVIRMLEDYVGADQWRRGVQAYLRANAYGNTVSDDLWRQIERAAGQPILGIAHDFTLQPGVPMVSVAEAVCTGGATRVRLRQGEFSKDQPGKAALRWRVPVVARTLGGAPTRALVEGGGATLTLAGCGPLLVNAGQAGYYRTRYSAPQFAALAASYARLAPIDQLGLMADSWSLGMAGQQPASDFLDLVRATPPDADPQVWGRIASQFRSLSQYYEQADPARRERMARYAIARLAAPMARLGWEARAGDTTSVVNLRAQLIQTLGELGDPAIVAEARRRYAQQDGDGAAMPPALRKTILGVVARHADSATWARLRAAARSEPTPVVKSQLYLMLASSADPALARRALELALGDEPGATDSPAMIGRVAQLHPDLAFDFALAHLEQVTARLDASAQSRYLPGLASQSADPAMLAKLSAYAEQHLPAGARGEAETALASIQYRLMVGQQRLPAIDAWLLRQRP